MLKDQEIRDYFNAEVKNTSSSALKAIETISEIVNDLQNQNIKIDCKFYHSPSDQDFDLAWAYLRHNEERLIIPFAGKFIFGYTHMHFSILTKLGNNETRACFVANRNTTDVQKTKAVCAFDFLAQGRSELQKFLIDQSVRQYSLEQADKYNVGSPMPSKAISPISFKQPSRKRLD